MIVVITIIIVIITTATTTTTRAIIILTTHVLSRYVRCKSCFSRQVCCERLELAY